MSTSPDPEQHSHGLSRLLAIGLEGAAASEAVGVERTEGEWLREMLLTPLPIELPGAESAVLEAVGRPTGELVLDPASALPVLEAVKAHAESVVNRTTGAARKAASVVYYAAIAAALVRHDRSITRFTHDELAKSLAKLQHTAWTPAGLSALFAAARRTLSIAASHP